jgi:membrane protein implicated in regulation of membrane protease activity
MIFFVLNNILAIYISICLTQLLVSNGQGFRRFLIAITNFAFIVYAVVITTGCFSILSSQSIVIILIFVAVCITPFAWSKRDHNKKWLSFKADPFRDNNKDTIFLKFALVLFSGFFAEWVCKSFILGTYFGPDDLVYHATIPAQWIVDKKITLVPFSYQTYYPFNAEIMSLWFMLPFHNDTNASITSFYWVLLSLVAIITILHSLGYTAASCILISTIFIGSTGVQGTSVQKILQSFSANDLVGPAMVLAGIALLFTNGRLSLRDRSVNSLYCGLMMGYAVGTKVSFAPIAVVIVLWLLLARDDVNSFRQRTSFVLLFILGMVVTGGFWYIRNVLITGNPLYPAEFGPFRGPFSLDDQHRTKLISWIIQSPTDLNQWLRIARDLGNWPLHYGIISTIGYITAIYFLIKNWPNRVKVVWRRQALLLIAGVLLFITFFLLPYSATTNHPTTGMRAANRYLIFSYAIGLLLFSRLIEGNGHSAKFWKLLTLFSLFALAVYKKELIIYAIFALAAAMVCFRPLGGIVTRVLNLKHAGVFFLIASFAFLMFWYPYKKQLTDKNFYSFTGPAGKVFKEIENLPEASRIGYFSPLPYNNTPFYRLFGRRLQMIPVPLDYDGSIPVPLHVKQFGKGDSWWDEWDKLGIKINEREFQINIQQSHVQYVIMAQFPYTKWPTQYDIFKGMGNAMQIYDDGHSAIWKISNVEPEAK